LSQVAGFRRGIAFVAIILGYFMALLDTTIVHVTLPEITRRFHTDMDHMSWIINGYNLAFAVFLVAASRIADQFGRKRLFLIGTALFITTSILCGLSASVEAMVFYRVLQGLSAAIVVPVTIPLAANLFPKEKHGIVLGVWGAISSLAAASGPTLGGILTDSIGWEAIFFVNVPIGIAAIGLAIPLVRESFDSSAGRKIDWLGMLTLSAALFSLTYGLINANDWGWNSAKFIGSLAAFLVGFILFLVVERRTAEPMLPLWLLRILPFNGAVFALLALGAGMTAASYLMSYLLTGVMGYSILHAGTTISAMSIASMVVSAIAGVLSNKLGSRWFVTVGVAVLALSLYLDGSLSVDSGEWSVIWRLILTGVGIGLSVAPVMGASIRHVPEEKVGIASGIANMARAIGSVLGVAILVSVLNTALSHYGAEMQDASVAAFRRTFHVAGWLMLLGIPFALMSDRRRGRSLGASGSSASKDAALPSPSTEA